MPFREIVGNLVTEGVEYYHVDYAANSFTFYSSAGSTVKAPIPFERLPSILENFDATALKAAILACRVACSRENGDGNDSNLQHSAGESSHNTPELSQVSGG